MKNNAPHKTLPPQRQQRQPGLETAMRPKPKSDDKNYKGSGKLAGRTALITGGDSGIGRAIAVFFAKESADVSIVYLNEHRDAQETKRRVEAEGRACHLISGDAGKPLFCRKAVEETVRRLGRLDILVNNAAEQHEEKSVEDISSEQLEKTFRTNIFSYFYMTQYALKHLKKGASIINTTSVTAYRGSEHLLSYSATKGAIVTFTRSLSQNLLKKRIRVNGVAPGPVWTPLIPSSFSKKRVSQFGSQAPMGRPAQPEEIAPCYVLLAGDDSSYMTGQILHPNGGEVLNT